MTNEKEIKPLPKGIQAAILIALLAIPLVFWLLPADQFDETPYLCPSALLFNMDYFDCGTIKALQHFHHFEIGDALYFHSISPLLYALLVFLWGTWTYQAAARLGLLGATRAEHIEAKLRQRALNKEAKK
jgi:nitrogen fixation-related uncharacterized protein